MKLIFLLVWGLLAVSASVHAQDVLDRLDDALSVASRDGSARARISGLLDLEGYYFEHPAPGLIASTNQGLFSPRLTLFLDAQLGPSIYFFVQTRLDRGFDPSDRGLRLELDEYAVRYTPWQDGRLSVQFGASATVVGVWTARHLSWENPFVNAPVPYENLTAASDTEPPSSPGDFRKVSADEKYEHLPVIWGPSYATGLTLSGRTDLFDYAAELKNVALSSRPESWSGTESGFDHPAFNGRIGFRPDLAWNLGMSAGDGAYLRPEAASVLPTGRGVGDYGEVLFGQDLSYSAGSWQFWSECFESRFDVPRAGHLDILSYYLETRYKFTPQFFGALRWNQQIFAAVRDKSPSLDTERVDAAVSYRFTAHVQLKLQYSFQADKPLIGRGSMVATQLTVRF